MVRTLAIALSLLDVALTVVVVLLAGILVSEVASVGPLWTEVVAGAVALLAWAAWRRARSPEASPADRTAWAAAYGALLFVLALGMTALVLAAGATSAP